MKFDIGVYRPITDSICEHDLSKTFCDAARQLCVLTDCSVFIYLEERKFRKMYFTTCQWQLQGGSPGPMNR